MYRVQIGQELTLGDEIWFGGNNISTFNHGGGGDRWGGFVVFDTNT